MPVAVSNDLRERIVQAYERGDGTYEELAERFCVSARSVQRYVKRYHQHANVAAEKHGGGRPPKIQGESMIILLGLVDDHPNLTLEEIAILFNTKTELKAHHSAVRRALIRATYTRKKKFPSERKGQ